VAQQIYKIILDFLTWVNPLKGRPLQKEVLSAQTHSSCPKQVKAC